MKHPSGSPVANETPVQQPITVLVPSYGRPAELVSCLSGLATQTWEPHQVVVVIRESDSETVKIVGSFKFPRLPLSVVYVTRPGVVHAMNEGLKVATGDIVALTDDDAIPDADWLDRIASHLADRSVSAVGGRDILPWAWAQRTHKVVGRITFYGKHIGNHHCGTGTARDVDVLKGVNCAFRRELLMEFGFDERLRGVGAQVGWEKAICLALRRGGRRIVYDPAITVQHFPSVRAAGDDRVTFDATTAIDAEHNEVLTTLEYLPPNRRALFIAWRRLIGTRPFPGLAVFPFSAKRYGLPEARNRFRAARRAEGIARKTLYAKK
ncbi:MAG: glycosyltransferase family 2 protein [Fimbriimonadaceae bacterium]